MCELNPRRAGGGSASLGRGSGGLHAEAEALDPALRYGHYSGVEESPDEEEQERGGGVIFVLDGIDDRRGEVKAQRDFQVGHPAGAVAIAFFLPGAGLAFDLEFRRAHECRFYAEERFDDGLGVAHREADADSHHEGHVEDRALPRLRIQDALRRQIETGNRAAGRDEERQVDEQHLEPALVETHDHRGQEQRRENHHKGIADIGGEVEHGLGLHLRGFI